MASARDTAPPTWIDGFLQAKKGINSGVSPLLLPSDQLAFATNCTMRGDLIQPRPAYRRMSLEFTSLDIQTGFENALWQTGCYYKPDSGAESLRCSIGGRIFQVTPSDATAVVTELTIPGDPNPANQPQAWMWQAELWTILNDGKSVPIFTDATTSRRSLVNTQVTYNSTTAADFVVPPADGTSPVNVTLTAALVGATDGATIINAGPGGTFLLTAGMGTTSITVRNLTAQAGVTLKAPYPITFTVAAAELPPGRMGTYGMGRNWVCLTDGKQFMAGDIVGGPSGTVQYNFRDSVLKSTENSFLAGGGYFAVPGSVGEIKAMQFGATLDTSLGQGPLQVFTPNIVFSCNAPVERETWNNLTNPILTESLVGGGGLGQDSTLVVNSDFLMRAADGIRSLNLSRVYFQNRWSNVPISQEVDRILKNDDESLLAFGSAVNFNNRVLMTCNPAASKQGVYHPGLIALDFDPNSNLGKTDDPIYDGLWTGLNVLKILKGTFADVERCFAFCYNPSLLKIELYEILKDGEAAFDNGTVPITWAFELPPFFRNVKTKGIFDLAELLDGEIYVDDVIGLVNFQVYYKPDQYPCWTLWHEWSVCNETNNPLAVTNSDGSLQPAFRHRMGLGEPSSRVCQQDSDIPMRIGRTFQVKVVVQGHCRILGVLAKAVHYPETKFAVPICDPICTTPLVTPTVYYNTEQCYTADFGSGFMCLYPTTVCVEAGQVTSTVSQADADAKALAIATYQATSNADCIQGFWNTEQQYTAVCPLGATGGPLTKTVKAFSFFSEISQADANARALAQAQADAQAELVCTWGNTEQSYTANCPAGEEGYPVTVTVPANTFTSTVSQADADQQALNYAQTTAEAELQCSTEFWNTEQCYTAFCPSGFEGYPVTVCVQAHTYSSTVSQADADQQALNAATAQAQSDLQCTEITSAWADQVVANGGARPSDNTILCMKSLSDSLDAAGLTAKIYSMCIFVSDSLIAATTPLISALGNDPWTNHNFVAGDLNADGLQGDAATKFLDTGVLANAVCAPAKDVGMAVVITKGSLQAPGLAVCDIAAVSSVSPFTAMVIQLGGDVSNLDMLYSTFDRTSPDYAFGHPLQRCGYMSGNTVGGVCSIYQATPQDDHVLFGSIAKSAGTQTATSLYCFANHNQHDGSTNSYSGRRMAMAAITSGFTEAESSTFWTLVKDCLQCLGNSAGDRAIDWSYRVQANGGDAPSVSTVNAIRTFWDDLYAAGINTKMVAMNVFAPDNLVASATPLVNRLMGNDPWTNHNFVAGDLNADGLQGDAATKYFQTGIVPSNQPDATATAFAWTNTNSGFTAMISTGESGASLMGILGSFSGGNGDGLLSRPGVKQGWVHTTQAGAASGHLSYSVTDPWAGYLSINRIASNDLKLFAANSGLAHGLVASTTSADTSTLFNSEMYAFALNTSGTAFHFSSERYSFVAANQALTQDESLAFYNAIVKLRNAFGGGAP